MHVSERGRKLLQTLENGSRPPPSGLYLDESGYVVLGYGHANDLNSLKPPMTPEQFDALLDADILEVEAKLQSLGVGDVQQNQWDALVSWAHSCHQNRSGSVEGHKWYESPIFGYLKAHKYQLAAAEIDNWTWGRGRHAPYLINRRRLESQVFLTAKY